MPAAAIQNMIELIKHVQVGKSKVSPVPVRVTSPWVLVMSDHFKRRRIWIEDSDDDDHVAAAMADHWQAALGTQSWAPG